MFTEAFYLAVNKLITEKEKIFLLYRGSIPGRVIPKTQIMVLDATLLKTQHYKLWIKSKVEQSRERSSALPYTLV